MPTYRIQDSLPLQLFSWFQKVTLIIAAGLCISSQAFSWGATGHRIINQKAPIHLPSSMSVWKADSLLFAAHASDADNRKNSRDTSFWAEAPRHFIDIDSYPNFHSLPHSLDSMIMLFGRSTVWNQGTLPWAIVREMDSLTAQFRRNDTAIVQTMSDLGHYVADAHQPLHCTDNYDGQLTGNSGIHSRYETTMINSYQGFLIIMPDSVQYISSPLDFAFNFIYHSQTYVDSIMAADTYAKSVSGWNGSGTAPSTYTAALWAKVGSFTIDQFQRATVALASLWYTAWINSQTTGSTITATATTGGSIFPSGSVFVPSGHDTIFTFHPQTGYHIDSLTVDGLSVDSLVSYTFYAVSSTHSIQAWFSINQDTIIASCGPNGSIAPSGTVIRSYGSNQKFSFTPVSGYHVDSIIVDGISHPADTVYNFTNLTFNHSITVTFAANHYTITATAGVYGSVIPSGAVDVVYGDSETFVFHPDSAYRVDSVFLDGVYVGRDTLFTVRNVSANHTLNVRFNDGSMSLAFGVESQWNMLSVPLTMNDYRLTTLYPSAMSGAFAYAGGYQIADTLKNGYGYWIRFAASQSLPLLGKERLIDTFDVSEGWNMIGSISSPVSVSEITSSIPGMVTSNFFEYHNGYAKADSIRPGYGYWVKVTQAGQLILSATFQRQSANRIRIIAEGENPPPPPGEAGSGPGVPKQFALSQAYPNPFNPSTTIHLELPVESHVLLKLYNELGQSVGIILDEERPAGTYDIHVDGSRLASGVYFYHLDAGKFSRTMKMVLSK